MTAGSPQSAKSPSEHGRQADGPTWQVSSHGCRASATATKGRPSARRLQLLQMEESDLLDLPDAWTNCDKTTTDVIAMHPALSPKGGLWVTLESNSFSETLQ